MTKSDKNKNKTTVKKGRTRLIKIAVKKARNIGTSLDEGIIALEIKSKRTRTNNCEGLKRGIGIPI